MTGDGFVLVASPFLGAFAWCAVAEVLVSRGAVCVVLDPSTAIRGGPDDYEFIGKLAREVKYEQPIWVAHSGGGALLPSLLANAGSPARVVLVDGLLPHPGRAWLDTAPSRLAAMIVADAQDGRAPPWPSWLGDRLAELLPEASDRAALISKAPATPLAFLRLRAPELDFAEGTLGAFLRLSEAYEAECRSVEARGWAARRVEAHHLLPITNPELVADHLLDLGDGRDQRPTSRVTV